MSDERWPIGHPGVSDHDTSGYDYKADRCHENEWRAVRGATQATPAIAVSTAPLQRVRYSLD